MKLLVVDDEKLLVKGLKFNLENDGYEVDTCYDGITAVEKNLSGDYDLILMDLMMPGMDGLQATMKIREISNVPIIMLTAKGDDTDKLIGFEYGADDYVTKPFNILELKARIRALLRRSATVKESEPDVKLLSVGLFSLDADKRIAYAESVPVELTVKEFDLLEFLMKNPGKVYSREKLLDTVWGYDYQGDIRTVDVHIRRLREKMEKDPASPVHIATKWGIGYYFKNS